MDPSATTIQYLFECDDGRELAVAIVLDPETLEHRRRLPEELPDWSRLTHMQCPGCPLDPVDAPHCPAALSLVEVLGDFASLVSYEQALVSVVTPRRTVRARTTMQQALRSLLGLYLATSGCPRLAFLKPLARFHLPFASREETFFRVAGAYLLGQYLRREEGADADWRLHGLRDAYADLQHINRAMAQRIRGVADGDANLNAIVLLDLLAQDLPNAIEEKLQEFAHLYQF